MKPGFTRLNLSYFADDKEIDYVLNAIEFLAYHAWKFLPSVMKRIPFSIEKQTIE